MRVVNYQQAFARAIGYLVVFYLGALEYLVRSKLPDVPAVGVVSAPSIAAAAAALVAPFVVSPLRARTPRLQAVAELLQDVRVGIFVILVVMFAATMVATAPGRAVALGIHSGQVGFFDISWAYLMGITSYGLGVLYVEARNQVG